MVIVFGGVDVVVVWVCFLDVKLEECVIGVVVIIDCNVCYVYLNFLEGVKVVVVEVV